MADWTPEREDELKRRWLAGETGEVIAAELGTTRSSVNGKASRMGLPARNPGPSNEGRKRCPECSAERGHWPMCVGA